MAYIHEHRYGVVLPKAPLDAADEWTDQVEDFVDLNQPGLFQTLWVLGLFQAINAACGSMVDEHEEEEVKPYQIPALCRALTQQLRHFRSAETRSAVESILQLARVAESSGRSLHFVL